MNPFFKIVLTSTAIAYLSFSTFAIAQDTDLEIANEQISSEHFVIPKLESPIELDGEVTNLFGIMFREHLAGSMSIWAGNY